MQDYSIEKLVIRNGRMISLGDLDNYDRTKTVLIVNDFDIDDDCSNHFSGMKSLEKFEVYDNRSRFYTEEGVLFVDVRESVDDSMRNKEMFCYYPKEIYGKVLVAFPTNYPYKKYSIPEGTVAIAKGAFENINIEELTIPSSLRFIDLHALDNTNSLRTLKVPNSTELVIMDHDTLGKQYDFNIVANNEAEELNEEVQHLWKSLTDPIEQPEHSEDDFVVYSYEILWPNVDAQTELFIALSDKQNILTYYKNARLSDVDDCIMLALFLFKIDTHLLHPSTSDEAELITQMLFGDTGVNEAWLKKYAGSPRDYKVLHKLFVSDKVRFFGYIGSSIMHDLLKSRAMEVLRPYAEQGYIGAIVNLLYIREVCRFDQSPSLIKKAAELGDPVSMWLMALHANLSVESERVVAVNLWKRLSEGKNLLPYIYLEDMQWNVKNNLRWLESHILYENTVNYSDEDLPF